MEKCIIISQSEAMVLLPLLKNSIQALRKQIPLTESHHVVINQLRSDYQSIVNKLEEAFND